MGALRRVLIQLTLTLSLSCLCSAAGAAVRVTQVQPSSVDLQLNRPVTVAIRGTDLHLARVVEVYSGKQEITAIVGAVRANATQGQITLTLRAPVAPGTYNVHLSDGRRLIASVPMNVLVPAAAPTRQPAPTTPTVQRPTTAVPMQASPVVKPASPTASSTVASITRISPSPVSVAPGRQVNLILEGRNLNSLSAVRIQQAGRDVTGFRTILERPTATTQARRRVTIQPATSIAPGNYQLALFAGGQSVTVPRGTVLAVASPTTPQKDALQKGGSITKAQTQKQVSTARMIPKATFDDRVGRKLIVPADSKLVQQGMVRAKQDISVAHDKLNTQLRSHPDYLNLINRVPTPAQRDVRRLEDGNYRVNIRNKKGEMQPVILMGRDFAVRQALVSAEQAPSPKNQQNIYKTLHSAISKEVQRRRAPSTLLKDMPTVDKSGRILINKRPISSRDLDGALKNLVQRWLVTSPTADPKPEGYPSSCAAEEGAGNGTDRTLTSCTTPSSIGLVQNTNWPLKYYTTCIKNQGMRGSCVAFSITGAVESRIAVQKNRWVNLSEQELYNAEKIHPLSLPPNCGDGLITPFELFGLFLSGHDFAWEQDWDYNPSYDRTEAPFLSEECYLSSCNDYSGGTCSNTNHQGQKVCSTYFGVTVCGYEDPLNGDTGFKIKTFTPIWNWFDIDSSLNEAKALLQAKTPVVVSFAVATSFDEVSADGYVNYNSGSESSRGNHAALLVGWVDNDDRPTGAPAGSGGGYFILKNSWGTCVGDVGYYYLPYNWVKKNAYGMDALNEVF